MAPNQAHAHLASALQVGSPFPWQLTLLDRLLENDRPSSLDLPTGLGKTSVLAIWLVARAFGAPLPRRLVYVVDRRAVIDQATEIAVRLSELARDWTRSADIAARLGLPSNTSLPISTLRGQLADNRAWLDDPAASAIVLGTIDMVGSRLLFEGYGVSRRMRPYHAGMLGGDALVVLDEAHLVPAFEALVRSVEDDPQLRGADGTRAPMLPTFSVMSLSATGRRADARTFRLTPSDEAHPVVRRRLDAKKTLRIRDAIEPGGATLSEALAREAWGLSSDGREAIRCIIFCNSRADAQKTAEALERLTAGQKKNREAKAEVELFVGGRRVYEREAAARWLRERGFLAGHEARPVVPTFVIATSAGEVGVDLDADHMVSDVVAWERMIQRLGRVNRRGDGDASVIVVPSLADKKTRDALEKQPEARKPEEHALARRAEMLAASQEVLSELPAFGEGRDGSPRALVVLRERAGSDEGLARLIRTATTPAPLRPALTRPLLEAWSMTSLEEHAGRPEVQPWIRGWTDDPPQTAVTWRGALPLTASGQPLAKRELDAFFEAASPHLLEALETETYLVMEWLEARLEALALASWSARSSSGATCDEAADSDQGDDLATGETADGEAEDAAGDVETLERPAGEHDERKGRPKKRALNRRDIVAFVLPLGGDPWPLRGTDVLRPDPRDRKRALERLTRQLRGGRLLVDARLGGLDENGLLSDEVSDVVMDVTTLGAGVPFRVLQTTSETPVEPEQYREELRLVVHASPEGAADGWLTVERPIIETAVTEEGRSVSRAQLLDAHEACAEKWAREIAARLQLPDTYAEMLAVAARLHDEGKKARLWQRAFRAPDDGVYGKTTSRPNIALLGGYRHEFGSLPYAAEDARVARLPEDLKDLCLHLIAAHHGRARPVISTNGCEDAPPSALDERAREVALRFARLERQWGPWGLAWWEVLLRAADQQASRENDAPARRPQGAADG